MANMRGNRALKSADRYLGVPLIALAGLLHRLYLPFKSPCSAALKPTATVGVLATGAIGDTILASGIISDLRRHLPEGRVILFTSSTNDAVSSLTPGVDKSCCLPVTRPWAAAAMLRREKCDALLDCGPWPRLNALLAWLSGSDMTVGFSTPGQYRHYAYDHVIAHSTRCHQIDNLRSLLGPLGVRSNSPPSIRSSSVELPDSVPRDGYVVFHAWPGGYKSQFKRWPQEHWLRLAELVTRQWDLPIVLTGGKLNASASADLAQAMIAAGTRVIDIAGCCSLELTATVLHRSRAVVSVDTGILHLAAAVGARVVGLHGPTRSQRWGGVGNNVIAIDAPGSDRGYLDLGFDFPRNPPDCMRRIQPSQVLAALGLHIESPDWASRALLPAPMPREPVTTEWIRTAAVSFSVSDCPQL